MREITVIIYEQNFTLTEVTQIAELHQKITENVAEQAEICNVISDNVSLFYI